MTTESERARVLVIDDERGPRESLRMLLKPDYDVACAGHVDEGLLLFKSQRPDMVIMDIRMPGKTGIEGLKEIRALDQDIAVVMLTGFGALETAQQALRLGATDYLNKPFDINEMKQVVARYVLQSRNARRRASLLAELHQTNDRLLADLADKERVAAMGQTTAEFVHDLRNPLTIVSGYVQLLTKEIEKTREMTKSEPGMVSEYLDVIGQNVQRCCELARMWQKLRQAEKPEHAALPLAQLFDDLAVSVEPLAATERVAIRCVNSCDDEHVQGSATQLVRALHNVVANAIQAVQPGTGSVEVFCERANGHALIRVVDNGMGMSPDVLRRVFEPYFTTKGDGRGTGLGLAITRRIVEEHRGSIDVQSVEGKGTAVHIRLPVCQSPVAA